MTKRSIAALVASLALLAISPASHAGLVEHAVEADCTGTTDAAGNGVCEASFTFTDPGFVSNIDTHGNFHELLTPGGAVTLRWYDAAGELVYEATCLAAGLSVDGTGPLDVQSVTCTGGTGPAEAVEGAQRLVATASGAANTPFHGHLAISASDALI